jgi:hypothetical protein
LLVDGGILQLCLFHEARRRIEPVDLEQLIEMLFEAVS